MSSLNRTQSDIKASPKKLSLRGGLLLALLLLTLAALSGGALARYVRQNQRRAEMISAQFHVSSDLLEETNKVYNIPAEDFELKLYNYEKENVAQLSKMDIKYKVEVENGTAEVANETGAKLSGTDYTISTNENGIAHTLHITPDANAGEGTDITVTVKTTAPYEKTLTATFHLTASAQPSYSIEDQNDGSVLVSLDSNNYEGNVNINWNAERFSPDNCNPLMADWEDTSSSGTITVEKNSSYELLFFKKTNGTVEGTNNGVGTTIPLS